MKLLLTSKFSSKFMSRLYFFRCRPQDKLIPFYELHQGWIDATSKIGYHLTIDGVPDEPHERNWIPIIMHTALCRVCHQIYLLVVRNINWNSEWESREQTATLFIDESMIDFIDGHITDHKVFKINVQCPHCEVELLTASQMVEHSVFTKTSKMLGLKPKDTLEPKLTCLLCGSHELEFDHVIRY